MTEEENKPLEWKEMRNRTNNRTNKVNNDGYK